MSRWVSFLAFLASKVVFGGGGDTRMPECRTINATTALTACIEGGGV